MGNKDKAIALRVSDFSRAIIRIVQECTARLTGQKFYCNALQGQSEYNISINSDLSVSCNCQDRGEGTIGHLDEDSFENIFHGEKAEAFRDALAKRKLPILTCTRCSDLRRLKKNETPPPVRMPYRGMMLENTIACNFDCPGCIRQEVVPGRRKMTLSLEDLNDIAPLLKRLELQKLFYFNRGEPFLSSRIDEELQIIRQYAPDLHICTSTNGSVINSDKKRDAALLMDEVEISIDGCDQETLERYQKGGSFERAYKNMKALVEYRNGKDQGKPILEWKYVLFNWNDKPKQIEKAITLAREAGVDLISFWPTNSPFYGISWRYRLGRFNHIGTKSWKGREVWFSDRMG